MWVGFFCLAYFANSLQKNFSYRIHVCVYALLVYECEKIATLFTSVVDLEVEEPTDYNG